jgi:hypothetical protein
VWASAYLTLAVAALVLGISRAEEHGWATGQVWVLVATAAALAVVVAVRSRRHPQPLLPPALFRERTFTAANLATFVFGAGFAANILNNVLFLRLTWGYGVVEAGLLSVLAPVVVAGVSVLAGRLMARTGYRPLLVGASLGYALVAVAQTTLLGEDPTPWTRWLPLMLVLGVTIGCTFPVLAAASVSTLAPDHFALGGAINNTARQVGAAVGVALVVTLQGSGQGIDGFRAGWLFVAACGVVAAVISLAQPGLRPVTGTDRAGSGGNGGKVPVEGALHRPVGVPDDVETPGEAVQVVEAHARQPSAEVSDGARPHRDVVGDAVHHRDMAPVGGHVEAVAGRQERAATGAVAPMER